ncbi:hypothetical protein PC123_g5356 [Phytophthora cactorum]|nr:hypothetical protein PC123_g5356 [Phytophthora cactorum]
MLQNVSLEWQKQPRAAREELSVPADLVVFASTVVYTPPIVE